MLHLRWSWRWLWARRGSRCSCSEAPWPSSGRRRRGPCSHRGLRGRSRWQDFWHFPAQRRRTGSLGTFNLCQGWSRPPRDFVCRNSWYRDRGWYVLYSPSSLALGMLTWKSCRRQCRNSIHLQGVRPRSRAKVWSARCTFTQSFCPLCCPIFGTSDVLCSISRPRQRSSKVFCIQTLADEWLTFVSH